jgi:hypothetical protein
MPRLSAQEVTRSNNARAVHEVARRDYSPNQILAWALNLGVHKEKIEAPPSEDALVPGYDNLLFLRLAQKL